MFGTTTLGQSTLSDPTLEQSGISPDVNLYLTRNLKGLAKAGMSAGLTYDLANTPSAVLQTLNQQDPSIPPPQTPSVLGTLFSHVMNQQGHLVPIEDLTAYQQKLQGLGYLPPGYQPTGTYDPQTANANYLLGNDVGQGLQHGAGAFGTAGQALNLLMNASMPSHILKGVLGLGKDLVTSAFGTVKRLGGLATGHYDTHFLGEDALNVLSVLGMFTGVSEIFDAGRAGLGLLGALGEDSSGAAAKWLAEKGVQEGADAFARPAAEQMLADPSMTNRIGQWALRQVPGVGGQMADNFAQFVAQYGPRAVNEIPMMKAVGGLYSGLAKVAFIPQVAAVYQPHTALGKAVNTAPTAPWWADLPSFYVHPVSGVIPKVKDFMRAFRISDFGHLDPLRGLTTEAVPDDIRTLLNAQAYAKFQATNRLGQTTADLKSLAENPGQMKQAFGDAMHAEVSSALNEAEAPSRGLRPEYQQAANEWADKHPYLIRKHVMEVMTSAQYREANGFIGHNPVQDWLEATNAANTLTAHINAGLPAFAAADQESQAARDRLGELMKTFQSGDTGGRTPLEWQRDVMQAANDVSAADKKAQALHPLRALAGENVPLTGTNYDRMPMMLTEDAEGQPLGKRVLIMRADNPADRANLQQLLEQWNNADPEARAAMRPQLNQLNLGAVPDEQIAPNLEAYARTAATDVTDSLPDEWQQEFRSRGYKAVVGGHDVLLPTDIDPHAVSATKYSKLAYGLASVGLSPIAADQRDISQLLKSVRSSALDEYLFAQGHPIGSGTALLNAAQNERTANLDRLAKMTTLGRGPKMLARVMKAYQTQELLAPEITKALQSTLGVAENDAKGMAPAIMRVMRQAEASPDLLRSPNHTYSILDRVASAMRVHGWAGMPELLRSVQIGRDGSWLFSKVGDLPNKLMKGALALRFQFNPMFEARLAAKNPFLTMTAEDLPMEMFPANKMNRLTAMTGRDVRAEANNILGRAKGVNPAVLDDLEHDALNSGIFGYNLQNHQKYDAWRLYQREYVKAGGTAGELASQALNPEADAAAIKYLQEDPKHVLSLYGARAPLEKTVNAVFFPFSFEKKLLTQTSNWMTSEPVRAFLAYHTMDRINQWNTLGPDHQTKIGRFIRKYVPVFNEVNKLNAFTHGVSLGEMGGVYAPLAQALQIPVSAVMGAFHPMGVTDSNAAQFQKLLPRLVPGWQTVHNAWNDAVEQAQIATRAKPETTKAQLDDYFTLNRSIEEQESNYAMLFGASATPKGFTSSTLVPPFLQMQMAQEKEVLRQRYQAAAAYADKYGYTNAQNDSNIQSILSKVNKGPIDEGVVAMEALRADLSMLPSSNSGDPSASLMQNQLEQEQMRSEGVKLLRVLGPAWNDLWVALGYQHEFGPIAEKEIA